MFLIRRRSFIASAVALAFAPIGALGQSLISTPFPARPQVLVVAGAEQPVRLQSVRVEAEIAGSLALTRVEMVFFNPNSRVLEGELQFPLLPGQAIAGFALDVGGKLRDAVPVEKARGQAIFEDIARVRVDPGLLQLTQGNNFKLRIYPLNPGATRTVVLRYTEALAASAGHAVYRLPLGFAAEARRAELRVRVKGAGAKPAAGEFRPLEFTRAGNDWVAQYSADGLAAVSMLEVALRPAKRALVHTQRMHGSTYFYAEVPVPAASAPRPAPRVVALAWDSSGSGAERDHAKELALLGAYLRWMQNGEVLLVRLRDRAEALERHRIVDGDWTTLRRALRETVYDGATQLGAFAAPPEAQEVLLFSDGLSNFGETKPRAAGKPVHAICAAVKSDPAALRALAEASGGQYVDLLAGTAREGAARLMKQFTRLYSLDAEGAAQLVRESMYPRAGRLAIAGVLEDRDARLRLELAVPGGGARTIEIPLDRNEAPGPLAAGLWARLRVAELDADYETNRAEIRRVGKRFGLVTRETSLIVLETVQDYARHEIEPPQELRADYDRIVRTAARTKEATRHGHLERIASLLAEKEAWWKREFPKDKAPVASIAKDQRPREEMEMRRFDSSANRVLAAPAPSAIAGALQMAGASIAAPQSAISIALKPWTPDAPYARRMRAAGPKDVYRVYLDEKPGYAASTAFFLDAADLLLEKGQPELALRVLSNLAEMDLENRHILRILGYRLLLASQPRLATVVFRKVLELAPEEPQSWRDLGLALAADRQYQPAIEALYEVATRPWDGRFPEIELITLADLNAIVAAVGELDTSRMDPRLLKNLPLDLRVVLTWDADNTDIDLWITDPNGEKSFYGNRLSHQGGRMSQDFTGGYGPEEFSLKRAQAGKYKVEAHFYGNRQQIVAGATTLMLKLTTRFGAPAAQEKLVTLRLAGQNEVVQVGEFEVR